MKCPICGNRDGGCQPEFFCITLRTNFEEYSVSYFDLHFFLVSTILIFHAAKYDMQGK
jgi:hypothetical protein